MEQSLKNKIQEDIKSAMRSKAKDLLITLRMLSAAIKQKEVDERIEPSDSDIINIIEKMVKQRKDASEQYLAASRAELAEKEESEIEILKQYLPEQLSAEEIHSIVKQTISDVEAVKMQDIGKVMADLKPKLQGRADMAIVSKLVKECLQG
tara:strand:- start:66721 stop:67173 length:453 start_codon:yes stop_codon:yes gene_type:complete